MRWIIDARTAVADLPGGVARISRALCDALALSQDDEEIVCVTTGWKKPELETDVLKSKHLHVRCPNKVWSVGSIVGATSFVRSAEKKVGPCDAAFFPNLGFTGRVTIPYTLLLHDLSFLLEPRWFSRKMRLWHSMVRARNMIQNADHLFAVSETTRRDAIRLLEIDPEKITVIPIGKSLLATNYSLPTPPYFFPYVMTMGFGDMRKNTSVVIEAVRELRMEKRFCDLHLIVLGDRPRDLEPWMVHDEHASDERIRNLYTYAKAFLYPSWYEGYGLPLHEANACGTPIIASTRGALPETAPQETRFADPAKLHHWIEALRSVLDRKANSLDTELEFSWIQNQVRDYKLRVQNDKNDSGWLKAAEIVSRKMREISLRRL